MSAFEFPIEFPTFSESSVKKLQERFKEQIKELDELGYDVTPGSSNIVIKHRKSGKKRVALYMDFDGDNDVDNFDFAAFKPCLNGPDQPPSC